MRKPLFHPSKKKAALKAKPQPSDKTPPLPGPPYTEEQAREVRRRLQGMGYIWNI
jgi:hypothetical protein